MVSHPETGSDPPIRSDRESGRDKDIQIIYRKILYSMYFYTNKSFQYSFNFHVIHFTFNQFLKFLNLNTLTIHFIIYLHQINLKQLNMQFKHFGDRDWK